MSYSKYSYLIINLSLIISLFSCNSIEDSVVPDKPLITLETIGSSNYQKGDKARFNITATIPGGLKTLNYTKTVDGVESGSVELSVATEGTTSIQAVPFEVEVTEEDGVTVTITVRITDDSDQTAAAVITYDVSTAPTLTVEEINNTNGEYKQGGEVSYKINASIPGGLKVVNYTKTLNNIESSPTNLSIGNSGDTVITDETFTISITEDLDEKVTIKVFVEDQNNLSDFIELSYTVTASLPDPPTITASDTGNGNYEQGDKIRYQIQASIPGGVKLFTFKKFVDGVAGSVMAVAGVNQGDTTFNNSIEIDVTEDVGKQATIELSLVDESDQSTTAAITYNVVTTGQGGGGLVPILTGKTTLILGAEGSPLGGFLATSKGFSGVFKSSESEANQADIDITFGIGTTGGPSLISPDARMAAGLDQTTSPRTTFFKAEVNVPVDLATIRATEVENNIIATTTKSLVVSAGNVYSFVQNGAAGKKGYIYIKQILGSGTNRSFEIEFIVQQ